MLEMEAVDKEIKPRKNVKQGDTIISKIGVVGIVQAVRENTVLINVLETPEGIKYENNVTVINHKNYKVTKRM